MSDLLRPAASEPSFHSQSAQNLSHLDTTPPLTMPKTGTNAKVYMEHPIYSQHAAQKAEAIAEKATPGSAIHETEQLFERGCPKNGAAIFAALQVLTRN